MSTGTSPETPAPRRRGRLTVSERALTRVMAQGAREGTPALAPGALPQVTVHRRGAVTDGELRLTVDYPAHLPSVLVAAAGAAEAAALHLAGVRLRSVRAELGRLTARSAPARDARPSNPVDATGPGSGGTARSATTPPLRGRALRARRHWCERRPAAAALYAVVATACAAWWYVRLGGTWRPRHLDAALSTFGHRATGAGAVVAAAGGVLGLRLLVLAATGSGALRWRLPRPEADPPVTVDRRLVEHAVQRAVGQTRAVATPRVRVRRTVRVRAVGGCAADLQDAALGALFRLGFDGSGPRITVRVARHRADRAVSEAGRPGEDPAGSVRFPEQNPPPPPPPPAPVRPPHPQEDR
ncbi:hypothetical protein ACF9IK_05190 [Kitasatospora hibisci]|uniref:hypothetical protein n=1 Tax=Kitasatospora hibisci TaxID=3369522 RepID=UPI0037549F83